jgi:hypothetical protein
MGAPHFAMIADFSSGFTHNIIQRFLNLKIAADLKELEKVQVAIMARRNNGASELPADVGFC